MSKSIESVDELLVRYLEEDISSLELIKEINFKLKYNDPILKGELTTPYIEMLSGYQESVYLAYLVLKGRDENLSYLKEDEKEALSLKFKVEEGSDIIKAGLENIDKLEKLADKVVDKMTGEQLMILALAGLGYLSVKALANLMNSRREKQKEENIAKINADRETKLYGTFEKMQSRLVESKFDRVKQEAIKRPLYEYEDNELEIKEEDILTSEEALKTKYEPEVKKNTIDGVFTVDGVKGKGNSNGYLTFFLIDKDGVEISVRLGNGELDIMKSELLSKYIGEHIYLEIEIIKKENITKRKTIIEIKTKDNNPELFV